MSTWVVRPAEYPPVALVSCPPLSQEVRGPLAAWLAHTLRNASTPLTIRAEICRGAGAAALPPSPGEILRLAEAVARMNEVVEQVIGEVRNGPR